MWASPSLGVPEMCRAQADAVGGCSRMLTRHAATSSNTTLAFDAIAAALGKDLEEERRERKEQVGFLHKMCAKERELLASRADSLQRQLVESKDLWDRERSLLNDRLASSEAALATAASSSAMNKPALQHAEEREALAQRSCQEEALVVAKLRQDTQHLESRLEAQRQRYETESDTRLGAASELSNRVVALQLELESSKRDALHSSQRAEVADEKASGLLRQLRASEGTCEMLQRQQLTHQQLEKEGAAKLQHVCERADEQLLRTKLEYEEEGQSSLMRAVWQLQVADDCIISLRKRQGQESEACAAYRDEVTQLSQESTSEAAACRRLEALLAGKETEQHALAETNQQLENKLKGETQHSLDLLAEASRERRQAAGLVDRLHSRHSDISLSLLGKLESEGCSYSAILPQAKSVGTWLTSSSPSPQRVPGHRDASASWASSSLGFALSPSKDTSNWSGVTGLPLRQQH